MLKVVLVDDEARARKSLANILHKAGDIRIAAEAADGKEALSVIAAHQPDIVFLDVKMPGMNGFELLDTIDKVMQRSFSVIFLTAYDEFAIKAIKYAAFDYLLKPVDEEELMKTISRYFSNNHPAQDAAALKYAVEQNTKIRIRSAQGYEYIDSSDVVYIEGDGNYSRFVLTDDDIRTVSRTLKDIGNELPEGFIRVHKKYFINKRYLLSFLRSSHECILVKDDIEHRIPVSVRMMKNIP
ncbi:Transcriptional regulatory protein BtsR [bioreactor metagenome]|uniref:Transcriptional regulatory protein BtsR n=1 Tax=bioreactor metagenome TaxID=1076179 RepID=A0A645A4T6_9ZZZZ